MTPGDGYQVSFYKKGKDMNDNMKRPKSRIAWLWQNMKGFHALYIVAMFGTIAYNALQLTVPVFSGQIIDNFLTGENARENMETNSSWFFTLVALMVGLTLVRVVIVYTDCLAYEHCSQKVLYRVRVQLYDKIQHQDMTFFKKYGTGDLMTRVTGDLDAIRHMTAWVVRVMIESVSLFTAAAVYFFTVDVKMALCILVISPFVLIIIIAFKKQVAPMHAALREKFAGMNSIAQENIAGNRAVKAFAREDYEIEKFDVSNKDYRDTARKTALVWIKFFPFIEELANLMPVTMLVAGGTFLINGSLTMGEYVAVSGLIWAITNPMRMLGNIMNEFQRFAAASDKVMEICFSEPTIRDKENALHTTERLKGKIEFRNVSFSYEDADIPVLDGISFTVEPGQTVAIMGETGCGKTTLINLLPRFYEVTGGEVLIDGIPVGDYCLADLRKNIGLASQDVLLHSDTINDNIAYGDGNLSKSDVKRFARYSAAAGFIGDMPEKYETIIGERGVGLSGGQKQRISLARALAVRPSILILDDTTSAVDMETEQRIQEYLEQLDFTATKLIVAQRVSTARRADRIIVMKDGKILEEGTHEELAKGNGYYSDLVRLQTGVV